MFSLQRPKKAFTTTCDQYHYHILLSSCLNHFFTLIIIVELSCVHIAINDDVMWSRVCILLRTNVVATYVPHLKVGTLKWSVVDSLTLTEVRNFFIYIIWNSIRRDIGNWPIRIINLFADCSFLIQYLLLIRQTKRLLTNCTSLLHTLTIHSHHNT